MRLERVSYSFSLLFNFLLKTNILVNSLSILFNLLHLSHFRYQFLSYDVWLYYFIMNCGGKETVQVLYWIKFVVNSTNKEWPFWGLLQCQQLSRMLNNCGKSTHVYLSLLGGSRICFLWVLKELFTLKHVFKWRYWFSTFKSCYFSYNRNC